MSEIPTDPGKNPGTHAGSGPSDANEPVDGEVAYDRRLYEETLSLLEEARDMVVSEKRTDKSGQLIGDRLTNSCESLRLTARLTQVMAWVLTQRAVLAGEVSEASSFAPENRLGGWDVCSCNSFEDHAAIPRHLRSLLRRSRRLYLRVKRMETDSMRRLGLLAESEIEPWMAAAIRDGESIVTIDAWRHRRYSGEG